MTVKPELRGRAARLAQLLPSGASTAARTPFVLLVVLLLGGGLIALLVLNSALNEGSFELSRLKKETTELTEEQQALQRDVDAYAAPEALQRRAGELGLVPGGIPVFIDPDGTVRGVPSPAATPPPAPVRATKPPKPSEPSEPSTRPGPAPSPSAGGSPSATPGPSASPAPSDSAAPPAAAPSPAPPGSPAPTTSGR